MTQVKDPDEQDVSLPPKTMSDLDREWKTNRTDMGCLLPLVLPLCMCILFSIVGGVMNSLSGAGAGAVAGGFSIAVFFAVVGLPIFGMMFGKGLNARKAKSQMDILREQSNAQPGSLSISVDAGVDGGLSSVQESQLSLSDAETSFGFEEDEHSVDARASAEFKTSK